MGPESPSTNWDACVAEVGEGNRTRLGPVQGWLTTGFEAMSFRLHQFCRKLGTTGRRCAVRPWWKELGAKPGALFGRRHYQKGAQVPARHRLRPHPASAPQKTVSTSCATWQGGLTPRSNLGPTADDLAALPPCHGGDHEMPLLQNAPPTVETHDQRQHPLRCNRSPRTSVRPFDADRDGVWPTATRAPAHGDRR